MSLSLAALLALCPGVFAAPIVTEASAECATAMRSYRETIGSVRLSASDRDAIARVTVAEARNQGDVGMAAVVHTVVNRLMDGRFGRSVQEIIDAPRQFEPAYEAGGWRNLPKPSAAQWARVDAILNLILAGKIVDPSGGALYFQNPVLVAARENEGTASKGLTHFGGSTPSAVIRDHAFYAEVGERTPVVADPVAAWNVYAVASNDTASSNDAWNAFSPAYLIQSQEK